MNGSHSHSPPPSVPLPPAAQRLAGKVAIITGGASGIGESTVRLFVRHGAKVVVADIQDDLGQSLCGQLGTKDVVSYVHCDVTNDAHVRDAVDLAVSRYGKLDIMYNNAGISGRVDSTIQLESNDNFKRVMDVNVYGGYLGAKHAARVMVAAGRGGVILFTGSIASVACGESPHAYTASKHAVVGLMRNLCVELGEHGVRVNCISPCALATPLLREAMGSADKAVVEEVICASANLKGVVPDPSDVAAAAVYLGSDEARFVSGVNLMVDGGYTTTNQAFKVALGNLLGA
ncbi:unnamed protein product [Linum tenue]|uniref:Secoisolariciresinol dehydrogenase n=1 Tax=Linum tenue TaxID=586396 RepID=A0AAV0I3C3_9ROSI|nr:unnamed protein product [Linum tenue]